jgi:hypothetical protein
MARQNIGFLAFNRGILSPKALARVDLDRTRLSAEIYTNFLPKSQGAMRLRPGSKHLGSSFSDTGAQWLEFIAATDDAALLEMTSGIMRIWINDELLGRPKVDTTLTLTDTGWSNTSTGGIVATAPTDQIPTMTDTTTNGVTITSSQLALIHPFEIPYGRAFRAADDDISTDWVDTGTTTAWQVDFGSGVTKAIKSYTLRASSDAGRLDDMPSAWQFQRSPDSSSWTTEETRSAQTGWSVSEKRSYSLSDTGATAARYWRFNFTANNGDAGFTTAAEIELFTTAAASQVTVAGGRRTFNATSIGALARAEKRVIVSDTGTEHSLAIRIDRGPITLRVGSTQRDDDYVRETMLGTGYHNLAFTPSGNFWVTLQSSATVDRIVGSLAIGDSGTVEVTTPYGAEDLDLIRYDQSADVVYLDCDGVRQQKIERRGTGRSWSVVNYEPDDGPFLGARSTAAKIRPHAVYVTNATLSSDVPFFTSDHVGALIRIFHNGQQWLGFLGALDAVTDAIEVTGIGDTGRTPPPESERTIRFDTFGTWSGTIKIERSIDGEDIGFKAVPANFTTPDIENADTGWAEDTGSLSITVNDQDDNLKVWYRARITNYISGAAGVHVFYGGGGKTGVARITGFNSNTSVNMEVLTRFSDSGFSDNWQEGYWSERRGFPSAVALHGGRLAHAQKGSLFLSVADDYESFDQETEGDAGPIIRTLGSGPVDSIHFMVSLLRLIIGTAGGEITARSSSLDEPLTPSNSNASIPFSTRGAAPLRAVKMDTRAIYADRSRQRVTMAGAQGQGLGDYDAMDLTLFVPDLLQARVSSIAIQRRPDTRVHFVLEDGRVALFTYEPQEEIACWTMYETAGTVEKAMVLPGVGEDAVYYHVNRTINGQTKRFLEKWAREDESEGDTGLSYLADCAARYSQQSTVLLHFDGTDAATTITDDGLNGASRTWTVGGNAQIDTAASKFGGASLLLDGTGDYVTTSDSDDFTLGTRDWTIDCWVNRNTSGVVTRICGQFPADSATANTSFRITCNSANVFAASASVGAVDFTVTGTTTITAVGWHHVAFVRTGNVLKLFVDGIQEGGDVAITGSINDSNARLSVGRFGDVTGNEWNGWIDEFRIAIGIARWTANFTPPTAASVEDDRVAVLAGLSHLAGESVVVWGDDTGQSYPSKDYSPDVNGVQTTYVVDTGTGTVTLSGTDTVHHAVAGLPYSAIWKSSKLAYAAQAGTALAQMKRTDKIGFVLYRCHNDGLRFGADTGHLDPLPRISDKGGRVDPRKVFETFDDVSMPFPGLWSTDSRIVLKAKSPRPCTVLAAIPNVDTKEKV